MRKQFIDPNAMIHSLRCAFASASDTSRSVSTIRRVIPRFPTGKLFVLHDGDYISFYERDGRRKVHLDKDSDRTYTLARKRYLNELMETLELILEEGFESRGFEQKFEKLAMLILDYSKGNLDLARIAFTPGQYKWFVGKYHRKKSAPGSSSLILRNSYGDSVRSKSEQAIGNKLWDYAVPCHYEEEMIIDVQSIVDSMILELKNNGLNDKNVFYYRGGVCYWNVPKELQIINAPASLWHTYNYRNGCVTIHPDYTIMLADGTRIYWEHEGLLDSIVYRINAIDRVFLMRSAGNVSPLDIIETEEKDSVDAEALENIIRSRVTPGMWF